MSNSNYDRVIIDGNNFMFRAYYTKRTPKLLPNGLNTTPIHQFLYMLKNVAERFKPKEFFITWDKKLNVEGVNYRKNLVAYKEQRVETEDKVKIIEYIDYIEKFTDALGITTIFPYNLEADDVIHFLCQNTKGKTLVISADKDLLQLVSEDIHINSPSKDIIVTPDNFEEFVGVDRESYILYKAIIGDTSDNIPGLDKYGPVRAKKLTEKIVENGIDNAELTEEQKAIIARNIQVMTLAVGLINSPEDEISYKEQLNDPNNPVFDGSKLRDLFEHYKFLNFVRSFGDFNKLFNTTETTELDADDPMSNLLMKISL